VSARLAGPIGWLTVPVTLVAIIFLLAPLLVTIAVSVSNTAYVVFPPQGFTLRWYGKVLRDADFLSSLWFSTVLAIGATLGALALGVPAAFAVVRHRFPGQGFAAALLLSPLVFPVLITGVSLLQAFSMMGFRNTAINLWIAHVLVTTPYVVRTVTASLTLADRTLEDAARTLGAGPWRVFRRIIVPQIAPGVGAGALFAFLVSFDNFPISMWLADAQHNPIPMLIFQMVSNVFEPSIAAISTLMIVVAMVLVVMLERVIGLRRAMTI
jgi:putative spermidine/putrescine transport system permease protein